MPKRVCFCGELKSSRDCSRPGSAVMVGSKKSTSTWVLRLKKEPSVIILVSRLIPRSECSVSWSMLSFAKSVAPTDSCRLCMRSRTSSANELLVACTGTVCCCCGCRRRRLRLAWCAGMTGRGCRGSWTGRGLPSSPEKAKLNDRIESLELGLDLGDRIEDVKGGMGRGGGKPPRGCNTGTGQLATLAKRSANSAN